MSTPRFDSSIHDCVIKSGRPLRPGKNAAAGQRLFNIRCPDGAGFSARGRPHQPSARRSEPGPASGPKRKPLDCAFAQRHLRQDQTSCHRGKRVATLRRSPRFRCQQPFLHRPTCSKGPRPIERGDSLTEHIAPAKTAASTGTRCELRTMEVILTGRRAPWQPLIDRFPIPLRPKPQNIDKPPNLGLLCSHDGKLGKPFAGRGAELDSQVQRSMESFLFLQREANSSDPEPWKRAARTNRLTSSPKMQHLSIQPLKTASSGSSAAFRIHMLGLRDERLTERPGAGFVKGRNVTAPDCDHQRRLSQVSRCDCRLVFRLTHAEENATPYPT